MSDREQPIKIASLSSGRLRLRVLPESGIVPDVEKLLQVPAVKEVAYRKLTGSLLILYNDTSCNEAEFLTLLGNAYPDLAVSPLPTAAVEPELPRNLLSRAMYYYTDQANRVVHRTTYGAADLTSVIPVVFFAWALIDLVARPTLPRWFELYREGSYLWHFYQTKMIFLGDSQVDATL